MKEPAVVCKENNMAGASDKASAKPRNRQWTQTELKYFALVLADEKHDFGYKLDTLALKKTANKTVFEDIKKVFEESMSSQEFKEENERDHFFFIFFLFFFFTIITYIKEQEKKQKNKKQKQKKRKIVTKYLQYNMIVNTHDVIEFT